MKKLVALLVVVIIILAVALTLSLSLNSQTTKQETIKLGFIAPLSGEGAVFGVAEKNSVELALGEINNASGVNGQELEVIYEDGKCNAKEAALAAQKLVDVDGVKIILGGICSSETLGAAPITEENKVILFSAFSSSPDITDAGEYIFRNVGYDTSPVLVGMIIPHIEKHKRLAIISENHEYALGIRKGLKEQIANKTEIVADEIYAPGEKDFRSYLLKIKEMNPDALFINPSSSANTAGLIAKQAAETGFNVSLYGNYLIGGPQAIEIAGNALAGVVFFDAPLLDEKNDKAKAFMNEYRSRYEEPYSFWEAGARYDSVFITANALKACNATSTTIDTECVKNYLYGMDWYEGTIGRYKFDEKGDVIGFKGSVKQIVNGSVVVLE